MAAICRQLLPTLRCRTCCVTVGGSAVHRAGVKLPFLLPLVKGLDQRVQLSAAAAAAGQGTAPATQWEACTDAGRQLGGTGACGCSGHRLLVQQRHNALLGKQRLQHLHACSAAASWWVGWWGEMRAPIATRHA
jgi:hypothetical protein